MEEIKTKEVEFFNLFILATLFYYIWLHFLMYGKFFNVYVE